MKIVSTFYGRCDASDWKEAEELTGNELLEYMDFINIQHLSKKDAIFPFDFLAELNSDKCLIDVTLRTRKPVRRKRLSVWRMLGYKTMALVILPEHLMAVLVQLEDKDNWINISPSIIQQLEKELEDFLSQKHL